MRASTTPTQEPAEWAAVRLALDRHQRRREQGIPTLSVLVGALEAAAAVWQDWARATGRRGSIQEMGGHAKDGATGGPATAGSSGSATLHLRRLPGSAEARGKTQTWPGLAQIVERLCWSLEAAGGEGAREPLALAVEPTDAAAFLHDEPYSRARTLFAEGMVALPVASSHPAGQKIQEEGAARAAVALTASSLAQQPLRPQTAASFHAATVAWRAVEAGPAGTEDIDRARSAAERFLFDLLGDLPETAGLFELNVRLGFCFGPMPAEVDLLAAALRLAVEIDGFHHFRDPGGYRRDRRKDALLQRQGYLVLRFLAEDVVIRLEEILDEIRTAVAFRRATLPAPPIR